MRFIAVLAFAQVSFIQVTPGTRECITAGHKPVICALPGGHPGAARRPAGAPADVRPRGVRPPG